MFAQMRTINGLDELRSAEGEDLGTSDWHDVTQADIDTFADVTGDHQWIHVDPERAKETPFGGTIAHGYYTLSLAPKLSEQVVEFKGFAFALNYGLEKVRFPSHMPVGGQVRAHVKLAEVKDIPGGAHVKMQLTFERDGGDKPVCVAETVVRVYTG
jgi:acyl dehydratase